MTIPPKSNTPIAPEGAAQRWAPAVVGHAAEPERRSDNGWRKVAAFLALTVLITTLANWISEDAFVPQWRWPMAALLSLVGVFVLVALPLRHSFVLQHRGARARETVLVAEAERRDFEARLGRALDMASDEPTVLRVAGRAFHELDAELHVELLLADHPGDVLASVETAPLRLSGCGITDPQSCPAVRNGHSMRFSDSKQLDACPQLAHRSDGPCGVVCVPVSIMGTSVGVIHAMHAQYESPDAWTVSSLESVAQQVGGRLGLLAAMSQSQMQANTDPLTGLLNRRSLEVEVRTLLRTNTPLALVLADLDHFKLLNDEYGHDVGDQALRLFATTMRRVARETDIIARIGGEEFVLVFPRANAVDAGAIFDRIRQELQVTLSGGHMPPFTVSAGVSDTGEAGSLDELVRLADALLRNAKRSGRNRVLLPRLTEPRQPITSRVLTASEERQTV